MLFNSFEFLVFFPIVCVLYFMLPHKYRWIWLLIASYFFYMNWKPIYALLMFGSTITTYISGLLIDKYRSQNKVINSKAVLVICLILNLSCLGFFKYFNFINESIWSVLEICGLKWNVPNFDILLPVGISFYTFQAIGYVIDVYRGTIRAERNLGIFALFVSFFPQLVAGPIERAKNLLGQLREKHIFSVHNLVAGGQQMLWGFFMKIVIADRLSLYVDAVYNNEAYHNGTSFSLATIFFAFQIYCDFGGYSNIAIGCARIMGFNLMENFRRPYFAQSIREFWQRWHISLSTWFRDYVYVPLGGNRVPFVRHLVNLLITFIVSGIWHGANWTFVCWGTFHGMLLVLLNIKNLKCKLKKDNVLIRLFNIAITFCVVCIGWVFFRANSVEQAFSIIEKIFTNHAKPFLASDNVVQGFFGISILLLKDFIDEYYSEKNLLLKSNSLVVRYCCYLFLITVILLMGIFGNNQFIYFQF